MSHHLAERLLEEEAKNKELEIYVEKLEKKLSQQRDRMMAAASGVTEASVKVACCCGAVTAKSSAAGVPEDQLGR